MTDVVFMILYTRETQLKEYGIHLKVSVGVNRLDTLRKTSLSGRFYGLVDPRTTEIVLTNFITIKLVLPFFNLYHIISAYLTLIKICETYAETVYNHSPSRTVSASKAASDLLLLQ